MSAKPSKPSYLSLITKQRDALRMESLMWVELLFSRTMNEKTIRLLSEALSTATKDAARYQRERDELAAALRLVPLDCRFDVLNPCGGAKHWGGGDGCWACTARAALAKLGS